MSDDIVSDGPGRGVTVTVKYGKGYEEPWAVFRGLVREVREDIITFFGLDRESVAELTLSEITVNAKQVAQGKGAVASKLGGTVISSRSSQDKPAATGDDAWAEADKPAEPEKSPLYDLIQGTQDVAALQRLYAENAATFKADADLMKAWKTHGKSLKAAA